MNIRSNNQKSPENKREAISSLTEGIKKLDCDIKMAKEGCKKKLIVLEGEKRKLVKKRRNLTPRKKQNNQY